MFRRRSRRLQGDLHQDVELSNILEKQFLSYNCILAASVTIWVAHTVSVTVFFKSMIYYCNNTVLFITAYSLHVVKKLYVDM